MGLGLKDIFPPSQTNESEQIPWSENTFAVLFTNEALTAYVLPIQSAPSFWAAGGIGNFSLGLAAREGMGNHTYWQEVRRALRMGLEGYYLRGRELGRVLVYGDAVENEVFLQLVREEVEASQNSEDEEKRPLWLVREPVFAGARGAAIFGNWCQRGLRGGNWEGCFPDISPQERDWF